MVVVDGGENRFRRIVDETITDEVLEPLSYQGLMRGGFKPIILSLLAEGYDPDGVCDLLESEYGVYVKRKDLDRLFKAGDFNEQATNLKRRISAELYRDAVAKREVFDKKMAEALGGDNLRAVQLYAKEYREWWDRMGKFGGITSGDSMTVNVTQQNLTVNPVQVLLESLDEHPEMADIIDVVIAKMQGSQGAQGAQ